MNPAAFRMGGVVRVGRRNMGAFLPTHPPRNVVQFQGDTPWNPGKGASPLCTPPFGVIEEMVSRQWGVSPDRAGKIPALRGAHF